MSAVNTSWQSVLDRRIACDIEDNRDAMIKKGVNRDEIDFIFDNLINFEDLATNARSSMKRIRAYVAGKQLSFPDGVTTVTLPASFKKQALPGARIYIFALMKFQDEVALMLKEELALRVLSIAPVGKEQVTLCAERIKVDAIIPKT